MIRKLFMQHFKNTKFLVQLVNGEFINENLHLYHQQIFVFTPCNLMMKTNYFDDVLADSHSDF